MTHQNAVFIKALYVIMLITLYAMVIIFGFYPLLGSWPKAILATVLLVVVLKKTLPHSISRLI